VVVSCLLVLLCVDYRAIAQTLQRGIANVSISQLTQRLSTEFSTIIKSGLGADQLVVSYVCMLLIWLLLSLVEYCGALS